MLTQAAVLPLEHCCLSAAVSSGTDRGADLRGAAAGFDFLPRAAVRPGAGVLRAAAVAAAGARAGVEADFAVLGATEARAGAVAGFAVPGATGARTGAVAGFAVLGATGGRAGAVAGLAAVAPPGAVAGGGCIAGVAAGFAVGARPGAAVAGFDPGTAVAGAGATRAGRWGATGVLRGGRDFVLSFGAGGITTVACAERTGAAAASRRKPTLHAAARRPRRARRVTDPITGQREGAAGAPLRLMLPEKVSLVRAFRHMASGAAPGTRSSSQRACSLRTQACE